MRQGHVGHDLRHGVGHGQQDGVLGHALDHLARHQAGAGDADEHIGPDQGVGQGAVLVFPVGPGGQGGVMGGQTGVPLAEDAVLVAEDHVGKALVQQQLGGGTARGPDAVEDDLHVLLLLADDLQGVGQGGGDDHGGAVLVVVEDGDVTDFLQPPLHLEAPGGGDVLQVDAAEALGDEGDGLDHLVHVLGVHAQGEGIDACKFLEEDALALHDGHPGHGADVAQAQHGGAVGDDGDHVLPPGELEGLGGVFLNLQAGGGHAGSVGQGEVLLGLDGVAGDDLQLALELVM